jgi:hypothetical protein
MNERDWGDICTILTQIEAAIQCGDYSGTKRHMQLALAIARRRHEEVAASVCEPKLP